jgi:hypothetical protein
MTLNASGNLSIGNTNNTYKLDVNGTGNFSTARANYFDIPSGTGFNAFQMGADTFSGGWYVYDATNGSYRFKIANSGAATFSSTLAAAGTISYTGTSNAFAATNGNTGYIYQYMGNTGNTTYFGIERSTGGGLMTGSSAYAVVLSSNTAAVNLEFGTSGTKRLTLDGSTGAATFSSNVTAVRGFFNSGGNETDPIISVTGDTNTGFFFPSADTIAATTAGTERMRITSGGNVGIGATSFSGRFSVHDSIYSEYFRVASGVISGNTTSIYIAWNNGGNIDIRQVLVGAADSGGTGYRLLRIPNT